MCSSKLSAGFSGSDRHVPVPALHWQGQSAAVPWQQLSLPLTGQNLNQLLCSQKKGALKESDDGDKATVPPVGAGHPYGIKIPQSLGDALGREEGLSLALGPWVVAAGSVSPELGTTLPRPQLNPSLQMKCSKNSKSQENKQAAQFHRPPKLQR